MTLHVSSSSTLELVGSQTPRIWTPRDENYKTAGPLLASIAGIAGFDLDEWQIVTVDVGLEHTAGRWVHRTVVLLVARQNGKTVILEARVLLSLFGLPTEKLILHTAQDRAVPRELFEDLVARIGDTPALHKRIAKRGIRETNGQERIRLKDGSTYRIIAPRPKAFRSWSADLLIFDEAREQRDADLWGAAIPTQRARPNPQTWVVSNAGDPDSVVLNNLRDRGRAAADQPDTDRGIAYLEWSAQPNREPTDPEGWVEANPTLGDRLSVAAIEEELRTLSEDRFRTEVLCQWVETRGPVAIPWDAWDAAGGEPPEVEAGVLPRPQMGVHVSGDRTHAALAMAAIRDGRLVADVVEEWRDPAGVDLLDVTAAVLAWMKHYKVRELAYDRRASSVIAQRLERRRLNAERIDAAEYVIASQNLHDAITTGYLLHRNNPSLNTQIAAAGKRTRDDGSWFISQAESAESVTGVLALAFAVNLAYRPQKASAVHTSTKST